VDDSATRKSIETAYPSQVLSVSTFCLIVPMFARHCQLVASCGTMYGLCAGTTAVGQMTPRHLASCQMGAAANACFANDRRTMSCRSGCRVVCMTCWNNSDDPGDPWGLGSGVAPLTCTHLPGLGKPHAPFWFAEIACVVLFAKADRHSAISPPIESRPISNRHLVTPITPCGIEVWLYKMWMIKVGSRWRMALLSVFWPF